VPNPVGQMRRDLTHHEFSFDHGKQPDQRRQVPSATTARGQDVWCRCAHGRKPTSAPRRTRSAADVCAVG
jgi:hypothetical protein